MSRKKATKSCKCFTLRCMREFGAQSSHIANWKQRCTHEMAEESACPTIRRYNRTEPCPPRWPRRVVCTCLSTIFCQNRRSPRYRQGQDVRHKPHSLCPCRPSPVIGDRCVRRISRCPHLALQLCCKHKHISLRFFWPSVLHALLLRAGPNLHDLQPKRFSDMCSGRRPACKAS